MSVISVNECLHYEESDSIISKLLGAQDLPTTDARSRGFFHGGVSN